MKALSNNTLTNRRIEGTSKSTDMEILIFKTDIGTKRKVRAVSPVLNSLPVISRWTVDTDDIDNVLRIEACGKHAEEEIIELIRSFGFQCEDLPD